MRALLKPVRRFMKDPEDVEEDEIPQVNWKKRGRPREAKAPKGRKVQLPASRQPEPGPEDSEENFLHVPPPKTRNVSGAANAPTPAPGYSACALSCCYRCSYIGCAGAEERARAASEGPRDRCKARAPLSLSLSLIRHSSRGTVTPEEGREEEEEEAKEDEEDEETQGRR